jgi:uncharacterized membrane protein
MPEPGPGEQGEGSSLHINVNLACALCYLMGCISGILFFVLETESKKIRFHALQSILMFTLLALLSILSAILAILTDFVPFRLATSGIWILQFVVWLYMILTSYQGKTVKIPGIGDFAREQVGWP